MAETANDDDFASIPGMPSDESIKANLLKTGGPESWNPYGSEKREPTDFSALPEKTAAKVLEARMVSGPGPHANPWQVAVWDQWRREADLEKEQARILADLDEVRGFDPDTGKGIPAIGSEQRRKAMSYRLLEISGERERLAGAPGQMQLQKAMSEAIQNEKARIKREYILSEAKRRAAADAMDEEIAAAAAGYRKTLPKP